VQQVSMVLGPCAHVHSSEIATKKQTVGVVALVDAVQHGKKPIEIKLVSTGKQKRSCAIVRCIDVVRADLIGHS
jgi:ethanolamine utilization protein EutP (predicted NTPase)